MVLFVVFELWGTGLQQAQAQSGLEGDFQERLQQASTAGQRAPTQTTDAGSTAEGRGTAAGNVDDETGVGGDDGPAGQPTGVTVSPTAQAGDGDVAGPTPAAPTGGEGNGANGSALPAASPQPQSDASSLPEKPATAGVVRNISEPAVARGAAGVLDPEVEALLPLLYPAPGEAVARITIPAIDVHEIVVAGVGTEDLRKGPGHYGSTPLPGQPGNAAIAGHRTTYGAPFGRIDELSPGDKIIVETLQGTFVYRVVQGSVHLSGQITGHRIVAPSAVEVLDDYGDNRLTLTSCHPEYSSRQRIVVHATLAGEPVVRLPRPGEPIAEEVLLASDADDAVDAGDAAPEADGAPDGADDATGDEPPTPAGQASDADDSVAAASADTADGPAAASAENGDLVADPGAGDAAASAEASPSDERPLVAADVAAAETPARHETGFGEGLSGDRSAIGPAVLWGLAAAAVWYAGWMLGRSRRRWGIYAAAAVPFLVVLYMTFSYIDRALPAY